MSGHTHLALLRAINTGSRRVTNDDLVAAFANLGFRDARGYQASGNVLFGVEADEPSTGLSEASTRLSEASTGLRDRLETGLGDELGFEVPLVVRSAAEVRDVADTVPFDDAELAARPEGKLQVVFCDRVADPDELASYLPDGAPDLLRVHGEQVYWLPEFGISSSEFRVQALAKAWGRVTVRTHGSVTRMAKLF